MRFATGVKPRSLPASIEGRAFSVREARELGVSCRRPDHVSPTRGVRAAQAPSDVVERARAFQVGLAERTAYSHVTAAELWCLPLPRSLEGQTALDVMTTTRGGQVLRAGCQGHRGLERRDITLVDDLRVTALPETWCDLAELGRRRLCVEDLVVIGDTCVRLLDEGRRADVRPGATTSPGVRALHEALGRRVRPRGKVMLREALDLIRPRVKSPMESRARLMFVRAGFPEPVVNLPILDEAGDFLAEGDLVWPDQRVIGEYQGEHHADRRRRSADSGRGHLLRRHIWTHEELWAEDVFHRPRRIAALRRFAEHLDLDPKTLLIA
jgi:hypothetical protein